MAHKKVLGAYRAPAQHWVGDGFPVRTLFSYQSQADHLSPFLLLDYAGPMEFGPADRTRGVGEHPHRGFETVTIVYAGEVAHRDSTGAGGVIGPGDVQWMTAASGILHEEFHSTEFTRSGGILEMVQLWVNLPAEHKMSPPRYQHLRQSDIPEVSLPEGAGVARVIAGDFAGHGGAAKTFTPIDVWDMRVNRGHSARFNLPEGRTAAVVALRGDVTVNRQSARAADHLLLDRAGESVSVEAGCDATLLILSGEPLGEPVVGRGPFVMNTESEIREAIDDFSRGRFGQMQV